MNNYMIISDFMDDGFSTLILVLLVTVPIWIILIYFGVKMCNKNNAVGMILLFISINIFGLVIGYALLYNSKDNPTAIKKREERLKQKLENLKSNKVILQNIELENSKTLGTFNKEQDTN